MDLGDNCCTACTDDAIRGGSMLTYHIATTCGHDIYWSQGLMYCEACAQANNVCAMCGVSLLAVTEVQVDEAKQPKEEEVPLVSSAPSQASKEETPAETMAAEYKEEQRVNCGILAVVVIWLLAFAVLAYAVGGK